MEHTPFLCHQFVTTKSHVLCTVWDDWAWLFYKLKSKTVVLNTTEILNFIPMEPKVLLCQFNRSSNNLKTV